MRGDRARCCLAADLPETHIAEKGGTMNSSSFQPGSTGLYIHVPFCRRKCPYCDFYSLGDTDEQTRDRYAAALCSQLRLWGHARSFAPFDTIYFGGGTPPLLGARNLSAVLDAAARYLPLASDVEVTLEANPESLTDAVLADCIAAGVNRLSIGLQSAVEAERALLGRRHTNEQVRRVLASSVRLGCGNLSVDVMVALPGQTAAALEQTLRFVGTLPVRHLSAYLLKVEPGTPFAGRTLALPGEDEAAVLYEQLVAGAAAMGFAQYEISNFAAPGYASRHNCKYWDCMPYLGLGPAAHSFLNGRRFYYPRDLEAYCRTPDQLCPAVDDGPGGDLEEYVLLRLRLTAGLTAAGLERRYGVSAARFAAWTAALRPLGEAGYLTAEGERLALTPRGFLVSNAVIAAVLEAGERLLPLCPHSTIM